MHCSTFTSFSVSSLAKPLNISTVVPFVTPSDVQSNGKVKNMCKTNAKAIKHTPKTIPHQSC